MTIEEIQKINRSLSGVTEDIKWEDHLCFSVGGKMFLVTSPDHIPSPASFRVAGEEFEEISNREGFASHKYLGRYYWVQLDDIRRLNRKQWEFYIRQSYLLVASKLPKKLKKELGL